MAVMWRAGFPKPGMGRPAKSVVEVAAWVQFPHPAPIFYFQI